MRTLRTTASRSHDEMSLDLYEHQLKAIERLKNGNILCGDVGTGKSRTAVAYYFLKECEGKLPINGKGSWESMKAPRDLYIITTAKKRDSLEWVDECAPFMIVPDSEFNISGVKLTIDSWNNIGKYKNVYGAFFIFDEQRVVGSGKWVKAFLSIAKKNHWLLLSATPGDMWKDYIPVFVANGFYKNRTEFFQQHVVMAPFVNFPKIDHYVNQGLLIRHRNEILVRMEFLKTAEQIHESVMVGFDRSLYSLIMKDRWNPWDNEPIPETGKLFYLLRRAVNSDPTRIEAMRELLTKNSKAIVFYNFDYELEILRQLCSDMRIIFAEWNGQKHEDLPIGDRWVYLVQYSAGAEGWNCITTNVIIFYSQNYSYRMTKQAAGRIDRMNTPYDKLYYYHLRSRSQIDLAIYRALSNKRNFNEKAFLGQ